MKEIPPHSHEGSVPHLVDQYYRARTAVAVLSGLLILLKIGGLALDRPIPFLNLELKDSSKLSLILVAVLLYSLVQLFLAWFQSDRLRRKRKASRTDLVITVLVAFIALSAYSTEFWNWKAITVRDLLWMALLLALGVALGGYVRALMLAPFLIRNKRQAQLLTLPRIPRDLRPALIASLVIVLLTIILVWYKSRAYRNPFLTIWPWPFIIPVILGVIAFIRGVLNVPPDAKWGSFGRRVADLKASLTEIDRAYQLYVFGPKHEHSPLYLAAKRGDILLADQLVRAGANPDAYEYLGWTPLMIAVAEGHEKTARFLLEMGADPNKFNWRGRTPLMFASSYGFDRIAEMLIQSGADVNRTDLDNTPSALAIAAKQGQLRTVRLLLKYGADFTIKDSTGRTAYDWATE